MGRNEILFRELLRLGRSARIYCLRGVAPLAIGVLLLALFLADDPQAGIHAFTWMTLIFNVFSFTAMSLLISGILNEERQANTMSVLFLAETSLGSILRGILGSRVILVLANLLACFPLLLSVMSFGGVTAVQMFQFATLMVSMTIFYGAFALWGTCLIRRRESSLCFIFACVGLPQVVGLYTYTFFSAGKAAALPRLLAWMPSVAFSRLTEDVLPWTWFGTTATVSSSVGGAWGQSGDWLSLNLLLIASAAALVALARRRLSSRLAILTPQSEESPAEAGDREFKPIVGNPISWLVLKRFDPLFGVPKPVALGAAIVLSVTYEVVDTYFPNPTIRHAIGLFGFIIMAWTFLWACLVSAQMWMEERTERTLELLLVTPFTRDEVILWKVDALFWALVTPTAMYSVLLPCLIWSVQAPQALWMRLFLLIPFLMCFFLYSYVGLFLVVYLTIFFAISATSAVSAVLSTLGLLGTTIFVNVLGFLYGMNQGLVLLAVIFDIALVCAFVPLFRKRLRSFELR